jgi:hypothetical protein
VSEANEEQLRLFGSSEDNNCGDPLLSAVSKQT